VSGETKTHQITIEPQNATIFTRNSRKTKTQKINTKGIKKNERRKGQWKELPISNR